MCDMITISLNGDSITLVNENTSRKKQQEIHDRSITYTKNYLSTPSNKINKIIFERKKGN